jgi:hypothetical protein
MVGRTRLGNIKTWIEYFPRRKMLMMVQKKSCLLVWSTNNGCFPAPLFVLTKPMDIVDSTALAFKSVFL